MDEPRRLIQVAHDSDADSEAEAAPGVVRSTQVFSDVLVQYAVLIPKGLIRVF